ncbi:hypothetical protein [Pseudoalteromonas tunicata]|nr:hypothetical protein [Pseudoalteromonas tunicata]MDP4985529.1 hypothetical protein [Pseudoalteromonas tunicata]MDP5215435.1 hypothetical protein [Pseudoalteromonas tunicata]
MSSQIVMTSSFVVSNTDSFISMLVNELGSESSLQASIQKQLNEIAKAAEKSKLEGSVISIDSVLQSSTTQSSETITVTVDSDVSTLTVPQSISMTLVATVIETVPAGQSKGGVAMSVSNTKTYPLDGATSTGIAQVVTALNAFDDGKSFDAKLTSATIKTSDDSPKD